MRAVIGTLEHDRLIAKGYEAALLHTNTLVRRCGQSVSLYLLLVEVALYEWEYRVDIVSQKSEGMVDEVVKEPFQFISYRGLAVWVIETVE